MEVYLTCFTIYSCSVAAVCPLGLEAFRNSAYANYTPNGHRRRTEAECMVVSIHLAAPGQSYSSDGFHRSEWWTFGRTVNSLRPH